MSRLRFIHVATMFVIALSTGRLRADVVSNFNSDSESWQVVSFTNLSTNDYSNFQNHGPYAVNYSAVGGDPGGYVWSPDPDGGDYTFSAPGKFLGNDSGATGLKYNLLHNGSNGYNTTDVMLVGNGERLLWEANPIIVPPSGTWISVAVNFSPSSQWHVTTTNGATATAADFQNVLSNLTGLYIRGEYLDGADESTGIDNVTLQGVNSSSVPEPTSLSLAILGALPLVLLRRKRKVD